MKAIVLEAADTPLALKEVEKPTLKPGEALVKLKAAALNRRDYWITIGKYAGIKYQPYWDPTVRALFMQLATTKTIT